MRGRTQQSLLEPHFIGQGKFNEEATLKSILEMRRGIEAGLTNILLTANDLLIIMVKSTSPSRVSGHTLTSCWAELLKFKTL